MADSAIIASLPMAHLKVFAAPEKNSLDKSPQIPILVVPSLINSSAILDLAPDFSLIEYLQRNNLQVYLLDWISPKPHFRYFTLKNYLIDSIHFALREIESRHQQKAHALGHCLGGTFLSTYSAIFPQDLQSLTLLTTPIDFSHSGLLRKWIATSSLDFKAVELAYSNYPPHLIQRTLKWLKPFESKTKMQRLLRPHSTVVSQALDQWAKEQIPLPGRTMTEILELFYLNNILMNDSFSAFGYHGSLKQIRFRCLVAAGLEDPIVPEPSAHGIANRTSGPIEFIFRPKGHIASTLLGSAKMSVWPKIIELIQGSNLASERSL